MEWGLYSRPCTRFLNYWNLVLHQLSFQSLEGKKKLKGSRFLLEKWPWHCVHCVHEHLIISVTPGKCLIQNLKLDSSKPRGCFLISCTKSVRSIWNYFWYQKKVLCRSSAGEWVTKCAGDESKNEKKGSTMFLGLKPVGQPRVEALLLSSLSWSFQGSAELSESEIHVETHLSHLPILAYKIFISSWPVTCTEVQGQRLHHSLFNSNSPTF